MLRDIQDHARSINMLPAKMLERCSSLHLIFFCNSNFKPHVFKISLSEDENGDGPKCWILIQTVVLVHYCRFLILFSFWIPELPFLLHLGGHKKAHTTKLSSERSLRILEPSLSIPRGVPF